MIKDKEKENVTVTHCGIVTCCSLFVFEVFERQKETPALGRLTKEVCSIRIANKEKPSKDDGFCKSKVKPKPLKNVGNNHEKE